MIDNYSFGLITVNGIEYDKDLIIFPDKIKSGWWRKEGHSLFPEDIPDVLNYAPEIFIVGCGYYGVMKVSDSVKNLLDEKRIKLYVTDTKKAVELFNKYLGEGKRVATALHLTC